MGYVTLIIGFVLIGLLTVHIFLQWHIITSVYEKMIKEPLTKKMIAFVFALICLLFTHLFIVNNYSFLFKSKTGTNKNKREAASNFSYTDIEHINLI